MGNGVHHSGPLLISKDNFEIIDCHQCGFIHVNPMPSVEELSELYKHEFYASDKPLYLKHYEEDREWWSQVYRERLDILQSFKSSAGSSVLDIGSGPGLFLEVAETAGWLAQGIEPSSEASVYCRDKGLQVYKDFFSPELVERLGQFDAVHMSAVLEHVPNAYDFLALVRQVLKPGGCLCVVVPNDFNVFQKMLVEGEAYDTWWVAPPHHLNYFTFDSLERLLDRAGLNVQQRTTTFPMEYFLLAGENYVSDSTLGRQCHARRKRFEMAFEYTGNRKLKAELYQAMAQLGVGREVVLYAKKTDIP